MERIVKENSSQPTEYWFAGTRAPSLSHNKHTNILSIWVRYSCSLFMDLDAQLRQLFLQNLQVHTRTRTQ